jgi:hypothetical protein
LFRPSIIILAALSLGASAQADQILQAKTYQSPGACQLVAGVAAGDLKKRGFAVATIVQNDIVVLYRAAHAGQTTFVSCEGAAFKTWLVQ